MIDIPAIPLDKGIIEKEERADSIGDKTITLCESFCQFYATRPPWIRYHRLCDRND